MFSKIFSVVLLIIGLLLTYMFLRQVIEIFTKDSNLVFFQIVFSFVWGLGASLFMFVGLVTFRSAFKNE